MAVCGSLHPLPLHPFHKVDQTIRSATCICDAVFLKLESSNLQCNGLVVWLCSKLLEWVGCALVNWRNYGARMQCLEYGASTVRYTVLWIVNCKNGCLCVTKLARLQCSAARELNSASAGGALGGGMGWLCVNITVVLAFECITVQRRIIWCTEWRNRLVRMGACVLLN